MAGGYLGNGSRSDKIEKYNMGVDNWEIIDMKLMVPIEAFSLLLVNEDHFMIFGGKTIEGDKD